MKRLFYLAAFLLVLFELANVFFIMPMPGSQEQQTIDLAYFLYSKRWLIRGILYLLMMAGVTKAWKSSKWSTLLWMLIPVVVMYMTHFQMAADTMFYQPKYLKLLPSDQNTVGQERLVLGVEWNGVAKAYPIQFLGYHHQVPDTIGGKPVMVTYCTVCRSGRVYEPVVNNHQETFRLVGMDHYNAMFEDRTTKSWWRQATGEAVAGPLKGHSLPEVPCLQTSLKAWLELYPESLVMQPDSNFKEEYNDMDNYESGNRTGRLTRHDTASWQDKSWIAGMDIGAAGKAYDWNILVGKRVINDRIDTIPVAIVVTNDQKSLFAFRRHTSEQQLRFRNDTLTDGLIDYRFSGAPMDATAPPLRMLPIYQEYWHSWRTFHPGTQKYPDE